MFKIHKEEIEVNGKKLTLETGKVARQADGAIIATLGETVVIATAVGAKKLNDGQDYFPLSVNKPICISVEPTSLALIANDLIVSFFFFIIIFIFLN